MSFAVDKFGIVYCWGSNKSNIMNLKDAQLTKVDVPTPMITQISSTHHPM